MPEDAKQMFQTELTAIFTRWRAESDLNVLEMAEASVEVINKVCNTPALDMETEIGFEPDPDFTDTLNEEED